MSAGDRYHASRANLARRRLEVYRDRLRGGAFMFALRYAYGGDTVTLEQATENLREDLQLLLDPPEAAK